MCKCGCDQRVKEQNALAHRDFDLWVEAQADPRDLSYAEALAAAEARDAEDRERYEEEVTAFVNRMRAA